MLSRADLRHFLWLQDWEKTLKVTVLLLQNNFLWGLNAAFREKESKFQQSAKSTMQEGPLI